MPRFDVATVVAALFSAGGVLFLGTAFKGVTALFSGAHARTREAIDDLGRYRDETDERARRAERDLDYYRQLSGGYAWQLRRAGIEPYPSEPSPPSDRDRKNR